MKKLYLTATLCLLLAGIVTGYDSGGHDNMCQEPHVGTALSGWWCDSPEDWDVVVPKIWTPSRESILVFQHEEKPQWGSREDLARSSKQV